MAENSKIEWTHHTFNPWIGCEKVSDGCKFCYAEDMMDKRYGRAKWGPNGTRVRTSEANWRKPLQWDQDAASKGIRYRVFCASLADVFEDREELIPWRTDLWRLILATPNLDWLLLTKRIHTVINRLAESYEYSALHGLRDECLQAWISGEMPPQNVWIGTSVENQDAADERIPYLLRIPAAVRFLSMEPLLCGSGCNFQRHCHKAIFLGIGFKFNDFIQAIHRIHRFLQTQTVEIHLIYTEGEREIRRQLERKWKLHDMMRERMATIIKEIGLSETAIAEKLIRALGVERVEVRGERFRLVNNDCVLETSRMEENSVGLILSSIPFSTQYEYSPNYADFGHTDNNGHFFEQMEFLIPELLRVLQPGRIAAIHVKDRIVPGGMTGLGFQVTYPFHKDVIDAFTMCPECRISKAHGTWVHCTHRFQNLGMKTIVTDVVRENNQTYRLGWTEQCKDGTKMGVGMPEYLLLFRKPPSSTEKSYADIPVVKEKGRYTRSRWQIDAHGFTRSSGKRPLTPEELASLPHDLIFKLFREYSLQNVYDFEHHVRLGEALEEQGRLPVTFMLLQPPSNHPDVWTDITRMLTLNGSQAAKGKELHLCPMQFDLADRVIEQMSNPGDVVYDPFSGLGTVVVRAIRQGRYGVGSELSAPYFVDSCSYARAEEYKMSMPNLFDTLDDSESGADALAEAA